jgi:hypothetical protein
MVSKGVDPLSRDRWLWGTPRQSVHKPATHTFLRKYRALLT